MDVTWMGQFPQAPGTAPDDTEATVTIPSVAEAKKLFQPKQPLIPASPKLRERKPVAPAPVKVPEETTALFKPPARPFSKDVPKIQDTRFMTFPIISLHV